MAAYAPSRRRRLAFAIVPAAALLLSAEVAVRIKYFVQHHYETDYLTTPLVSHAFGTVNDDIRKIGGDVRAKASPARPASSADASDLGPAGGGRGRTAPAADGPAFQPMVFRWPTPCVSGEVFSAELGRLMPRTWDANCFRGDRVTVAKAKEEFRIVFVGGSTVQDFQSDDEMMTAQFAAEFRKRRPGTTVLNAGRSGFDSAGILGDYAKRVSVFRPDAVLYYEAWNEQPHDLKPVTRADAILLPMVSRAHAALNYTSMLYTYLVEKYAFARTAKPTFFVLDATRLREPFSELARRVRSQGAAFVFVTQVIDFPRMWNGVDTGDYDAVAGLLGRMQADTRYAYDVKEISALNQRLAVDYTVALCRDLGVPVIDILDALEAMGPAQRAEMFMDLGHLTPKGDRIAGRLIAEGFAALQLPQ